MQAFLGLIDSLPMLDENLVDLQLDGLTLHDLLLQSIFRHQSVDEHLLLLADSVCSVHRLQINLRVEV